MQVGDDGALMCGGKLGAKAHVQNGLAFDVQISGCTGHQSVVTLGLKGTSTGTWRCSLLVLHSGQRHAYTSLARGHTGIFKWCIHVQIVRCMLSWVLTDACHSEHASLASKASLVRVAESWAQAKHTISVMLLHHSMRFIAFSHA